MVSSTDLFILALGGALAVLYLYRDTIFAKKADGAASKLANGGLNSSMDDEDAVDFVSKLQSQKKRIVIFYGSQTGTAEEYAVKIAKEAKARFGTSSLVCDPEEYEFDKLDSLPEDAVAVFVMATYGEGEPTDNAVRLMEYVKDEGVAFSNGDRLDNLKYVMFGLGNRTYEHFNAVARQLDTRLRDLGATRIGELGEGDDDKSMEEDYLAWKDPMFEELARECGFEEGGGGDVDDFAVTEIGDFEEEDKVYKGELSARALLGTKGIHDAKNPYAAPIANSKELFSLSGERSCIHMEFDIDGSGISYQHGDHVAVWANNPEPEVERILAVLGLADKRHTVIDVESLDPTLAKVPFPVPTTYEAVFRHYLDISAHAGRQALNQFAKYAPTDVARAELEKLGTDKAYFNSKVSRRCLKIAEVLQLAAGDDLSVPNKATAWNIPFDRVISNIGRVGPRFYSISSSPKLHPKTVHVTAVVLRYKPEEAGSGPDGHVHGLATNFLQLAKQHVLGEGPDKRFNPPAYLLDGPRGAYLKDSKLRVPIHIRRSNFRLPTSPKIPVIMVGPGTGVAPFRGFVQERVAAAQRAKEKNGDEALQQWQPLRLYYGCRKASEDFLYQDEWEEHKATLGDLFKLRVALSREKFKPDGSKLYVQDLLWEDRADIAKAVLEHKGYFYICGEAAGMARQVEDVLVDILAEAKGSKQAGKDEVALMKQRSRLLLDVWS